ncbi:MAG: type IV toxin-antitoxin system AbiEi family antitoxin domain-containing protein [Microbacterium sp.]
MRAELIDSYGMPLDRVVGYRELRASGLSRRGLERALTHGTLVRARRDVYLSATASANVVKAQRVGGRLDCLSVLQELGVFVFDNKRLHVQVEAYDGRLRSPTSRKERLEHTRDGNRVVVHWRTIDAPFDLHTVPIVHALAQSAFCQPPRSFVASIDSALNTGVIEDHDLTELFALLPPRLKVLRPLIDGRAEAGSETLARLLLRVLGCRIELQKWIDGVGRVDLVIDGWLVVECDSRAHHEGWEMQEADRERDLALAARGYTTIRPTANLIFHRPEVLVAAVRGLLAGRP